MIAVTSICFFSSFILLVYSHTPTFRNEATHPLKAPTESTLGLQDESAGRTKSNVNKEPIFSGGKHFEYMLLNDSNILLTSLQNDGPPESASDHPLETGISKNLSTVIPFYTVAKNAVIQTQLSSSSLFPLQTSSKPIAQKIGTSSQIVGKTNFKMNGNSNSVATNFNVAEVPLSKELQSYRFQTSVDVSSTTKLYSKQANNSEESFASFISPSITKSMEVPKTLISSQKQNYDYDDSFTKLLISNGILKPENITSEPERHPLINIKTSSNLMVEDINRIMDSSIASIINNPELKSTPTPRNKFITSTIKNFSEKKVGMTNSAISKKQLDLVALKPDSNLSGTEIYNSTSSHAPVTSHFSVFLNYPTLRKTVATEIYNINKQKDESARTDLSNENPLAVKSFTDSTTYFKATQLNVLQSSVIESSKTGPGEFLSEEMIVNPKSSELNSFHGITKKNGKYNQKNDFAEFLSLLKSLLSSLFVSIIKRDNQINFSRSLQERTNSNVSRTPANTEERNFILKSYSLMNMTWVLEDKYRPNKYAQLPNILRLDPDVLQLKRRPATFNWTNLSDGKVTSVDQSVNDLFEETDKPFWFILPLMENFRIGSLKRGDFIKYLRTDQALKLVLGYEEVEIDAIIIIPQSIAAVYNKSLPARNIKINLNEKIEISSDIILKKKKPKELSDGYNVTEVQLAGQKYYVLELLSLKSDRLKLENPILIVTKHDDVELYIYIILGAICIFTMLSLILYGIYHVIPKNSGTSLLFRIPYIFGDRYNYHEKLPESDTLNVIFSENFDRKYSTSSWLDNSQHSSSILKASNDIPTSIFAVENHNEEKFLPYSDVVSNPVFNSPRLNKENKLNMLGCRSSCVLLPRSRTYPNNCETTLQYVDNPNYENA